MWGGFTLIRNFSRYDPPPGYDVGKTVAVTPSSTRCDRLKAPELPKSKSHDIRAQLEHDALTRAVRLTCDLDVEVACPEDCTATYRGKQMRFDVSVKSCDTLFCRYTMKAENRFLSQRRLNDEFWEQTGNERKRGAAVRCDIVPGGVDLIPPDSEGAAPTTTGYRCYTRRPKAVTDTYEVVMASSEIFFRDEDGQPPR
ncbi:hypothetical protein B1L11_42520 [Microbispora sp. GKU 823]|nr:hypothetical protein B1L11_42520 [Microbispora sp. GKU 823]